MASVAVGDASDSSASQLPPTSLSAPPPLLPALPPLLPALPTLTPLPTLAPLPSMTPLVGLEAAVSAPADEMADGTTVVAAGIADAAISVSVGETAVVSPAPPPALPPPPQSLSSPLFGSPLSASLSPPPRVSSLSTPPPVGSASKVATTKRAPLTAFTASGKPKRPPVSVLDADMFAELVAPKDDEEVRAH